MFRSCREFTGIYLDDLLSNRGLGGTFTTLRGFIHSGERGTFANTDDEERAVQDEAKFLGHMLELQEGVAHIRAEEDKLKAIRDWPRLRCTKELQAFLGLANYYHRNLVDLATPLLELGKT